MMMFYLNSVCYIKKKSVIKNYANFIKNTNIEAAQCSVSGEIVLLSHSAYSIIFLLFL